MSAILVIKAMSAILVNKALTYYFANVTTQWVGPSLVPAQLPKQVQLKF